MLVQLVDGVSAPARKMSEAMRGIGKSMARVNGGGIVQMQQNLAKAVEKNKQAVAAMQGKLIGAVAAGYAVQKSVAGIMKPAIAFESAMADVAKVTNFSDAGLAAYGKQLRKMAATADGRGAACRAFGRGGAIRCARDGPA